MKLWGQRWRYDIGNARVNADNAYSWNGWCQERLVVNDETVQSSGGWFYFRRSYSEPWLTRLGDEHLTVALKSGASSIHCHAQLGQETLLPDQVFGADWTGNSHSWPLEELWVPEERFLRLPL